jgi:hypothetical protein
VDRLKQSPVNWAPFLRGGSDAAAGTGLSEKVLGKEHPSILTSMNNLSLVLRDQGKYEEAEATQRQALGLAEKELGKEHLNLNRGYSIQ